MKRLLDIMIYCAALGLLIMAIHFITQKKSTEIVVEKNESISQYEETIRAQKEQIIFLKIMFLRPDVNRPVAKKIANSILIQSESLEQNPNIFLAIIRQESRFTPGAIGTSGEQGLMQIMTAWKKTLCQGYNLMTIPQNIECGSRIYSFWESTYEDRRTALAAYNLGPVAVDKAMLAGQRIDSKYADEVLTIFNRLQELD